MQGSLLFGLCLKRRTEPFTSKTIKQLVPEHHSDWLSFSDSLEQIEIKRPVTPRQSLLQLASWLEEEVLQIEQIGQLSDIIVHIWLKLPTTLKMAPIFYHHPDDSQRFQNRFSHPLPQHHRVIFFPDMDEPLGIERAVPDQAAWDRLFHEFLVGVYESCTKDIDELSSFNGFSFH